EMKMEKVKLTRDQRQTVKNFMNNGNILKLTVNELHKVIDGEYEVESEFKVGDWVVRIEEGSVNNRIGFINVEKGYTFEVTSKNDAGTCVCGEGRYHNPKKLRHATPEEITKEKQRRWWKSHGRGVWELRKSDELVNVKDRSRLGRIVEKVDEQGICFVGKGHSPMKAVKELYRVRCFAKDRKDIEQ